MTVPPEEKVTMDIKRATEDIKTAADVLGKTISRQEMASECGVSLDDLQRAFLVEGSDAYRPPPQFWKGDLACLARERAAELVELADILEADAWAPATEEELEEIGNSILTQFEIIAQPVEGAPDVQVEWDRVEKRRKEKERRMAERAERDEERAEELEELNEMFRRGIKRMF
jgi:hypothetical protein